VQDEVGEDDNSMRSFIVSDSDMDDYSDFMATSSDSEWSSTSKTESSDADSDLSVLELSEGSSLDSVLIFDSSMERGECPGSPSLDIVNRRILFDITNQQMHATPAGLPLSEHTRTSSDYFSYCNLTHFQ
jgi:hypothetical protein